jgi:hypothetical protein
MADPVTADARRTKNSIIIYIVLTTALSSIFYLLVIHRLSAGRSPGLLILGLMWCNARPNPHCKRHPSLLPPLERGN